MKLAQKRKPLLLGSALTLSLAGSAMAATQIDLNRDVVSNLSQECQALAQEIRERNNSVPDMTTEPILSALNNDDAQACTQTREELAAAPAPSRQSTQDDGAMQDDREADATDAERETARDTETAEMRETVEVQEEATIEGQAAVIVPEPQVDVEVDSPRVTVRKAQPDVTVEQQPGTIQVEQPQPNVSVDIPEIVVRVEIPAPNIYVQTQEPSVNLASADPQVEVQQGEPKVTVRQPEPRLDVDLGVDAEGGDALDEQRQADASGSGEESEMNRGGQVNIASNEPRVEIVQPEGEPRVSVNAADPNVEFQGSEPQVSVNFTQEPTVEIAQMGEAKVTFETAEEREARMNEQAQAGDGEGNRQQANNEDGGQAGRTFLVSDLLDMDVVDANGEGLGEPEAVISRNGQMMLVIEDGGFLGLGGGRVAVPMERVAFNADEEELQLRTLSEEQVENAGDFEYDASEEVSGDRELRMQ
ncbi:MAG: PRC-barrel domain-containing protein [Pseudooceanicola sp.]